MRFIVSSDIYIMNVGQKGGGVFVQDKYLFMQTDLAGLVNMQILCHHICFHMYSDRDEWLCVCDVCCHDRLGLHVWDVYESLCVYDRE